MYNPTLHAELTAKGYTYEHHEDRGNGESGPMISVWAPCDTYERDGHVFFCLRLWQDRGRNLSAVPRALTTS